MRIVLVALLLVTVTGCALGDVLSENFDFPIHMADNGDGTVTCFNSLQCPTQSSDLGMDEEPR